MKTVLKKLVKPTLLFLSLAVMIMACKKDDAPEIDNPNPNPDNPDGTAQDSVPPVEEPASFDPNLITQSLILDNMQIIEGQLPEAKGTSKTMPEDLKIDLDTIFWTPGVKKRIKIKSSQNVDITEAWFCVPGADSYIKASVREDESTDEISIFYFEFDTNIWELPISFSIKIIPLGPNGDPIVEPKEIIARPCLMEKSYFDSTDGSGWILNGVEQIWRWKSFSDENSGVNVFAYAPTITPGTTLGSCDSNGFGPCDQGYIEDESVELNYESYSYIGDVYFTLKPDGTYITWEDVRFINLDICNSSFCGSPTPAYISSQTIVTVEQGTWLIREDGTLQLNPEIFNFDADGDGHSSSPMIGGGEFVQFKKISDHFLEETLITSSDTPEGVGGTVEKYELISGQSLSPTLEFEDYFWFDLFNSSSVN